VGGSQHHRAASTSLGLFLGYIHSCDERAAHRSLKRTSFMSGTHQPPRQGYLLPPALHWVYRGGCVLFIIADQWLQNLSVHWNPLEGLPTQPATSSMVRCRGTPNVHFHQVPGGGGCCWFKIQPLKTIVQHPWEEKAI
jgi:hypothetical protein